nr:DUF3396 domain-containing protein [Pseudomonas cichorii]
MSETLSDPVRLLARLDAQSEHLAVDCSEGVPVVRLGLITTLYFKQGHTQEAKRRVEACFSRFYDAFKPMLKWQLYNRMRRLTASGFASCRRQILQSPPDVQFAWSIASATQAEVATYSLFVMNTSQGQADNDRSCLKMVLPWSYLTESDGLKRYEDWIRYLCSEVRAEHGFGSLACVLPGDGHHYLPLEYQFAQEYPGLMVDPGPHIESLRLLEHIKGVGWYTVLGESFVKRLGGSDRVRGKLSGCSDIVFHTYSNGLMIRAGAVPQLGSGGVAPDVYREVNKVIKPIRLQDTGCLHPYLVPGVGFTKETTAQWYARFDEKPVPPLNAGDVCPRSGYWFSNAKVRSRRFFTQGEIMPAFAHIKVGRTQWFWAQQDD